MKFLSILFATCMLSCTTIRPHSVEDFYLTSVEILSDQGGGGTGVIFKSGKDSIILTNQHVCEAIKGGGYVLYDTNYPIFAFKESKIHDICYVAIHGNLHIDTVLSKIPPKKFDKLSISGHPFLYPHILSEGYLTDSFTAVIGNHGRKCTEEESKDTPMECIFEGHSDTITREVVLVSGLIAGGSSGSGVFNKQGELVGLAFAARGDGLSYALVVPWIYLNRFVKEEAKTLKWIKPSSTLAEERFIGHNLYDLDAWREVFDLLEGRKQCLKPSP